jgi:uncharacterized membrane protein
MAMTRSWNGPLPPPEQLALFNVAAPDAADRIIRMAESSLDHSHYLERTAQRNNFLLDIGTKVLGFVLIMALFVGMFVMLAKGKIPEALISGAAAAISGIVGAWMKSHRRDTLPAPASPPQIQAPTSTAPAAPPKRIEAPKVRPRRKRKTRN